MLTAAAVTSQTTTPDRARTTPRCHVDPGDEVQDRRLAAPRPPGKCQQFPRAHVQGQAIDRNDVASRRRIRPRHALQLNHARKATEVSVNVT
jgi:hypothetical protein